MGADYALSPDIREESVKQGRSDRNSTGRRSAGTYGGWRREKISGFDVDKLWVGGYIDVAFLSKSRMIKNVTRWIKGKADHWLKQSSTSVNRF